MSGDEVAPAGSGNITKIGIPDNEVTEDANSTIGIEGFAAPAERNAYLAAVIRRKARIGEGVVIVPDGELVEPLVVVGGIELHHLDVSVREVETAAGPSSATGSPGEPNLVAATGCADDTEPGKALVFGKPIVVIFCNRRRRRIGPVAHTDIAPGIRDGTFFPVEDLHCAVVPVPGPIR